MSDHDAHRPVRPDEGLDPIFAHQKERKISRALTVHFRRGLYLLVPGLETLALRGRRCRVHEYSNGQIEIRYEGRRLPFRAFEEPRRVTQGDIVANKRLSAALTKIQADQRARDQEMLASPRVSRRACPFRC